MFGYFIQGWFKFGGVEFFKIQFVKALGEQKGWDNRNNIYLASAAMAEFIADIFLCPYEACRIRLVSNPDYASGMVSCATKMSSEMGFVGAFYSGFVPILFKQIPYTMAKFAVQGTAALLSRASAPLSRGIRPAQGSGRPRSALWRPHNCRRKLRARRAKGHPPRRRPPPDARRPCWPTQVTLPSPTTA